MDLKWNAGCVNLPDLARVHGEETIEEDKNTDQGGRDQHASVPAQPCKVKTDFLTKVSPGWETERQSGQNSPINCVYCVHS